MELIKNGLNTHQVKKLTYTLLILLSFILLAPFPSLFSVLKYQNNNKFAALTIADVINEYKETTQTNPTLFCYKIVDIGLYNTTQIMPNNYFFVINNIPESQFPEMYHSHENSIKNQTSDFVITPFYIWEYFEKEFLSQYYTPYINNKTNTYLFQHPVYDNIVLLRKIETSLKLDDV